MARYVRQSSAAIALPQAIVSDAIEQVAREGGSVPERHIKALDLKPAEVRLLNRSFNLSAEEFHQMLLTGMKGVQAKLIGLMYRVIDRTKDEVSLRDLMTSFGILTDKIQLLEGKPTSFQASAHLEIDGASLGAEDIRNILKGQVVDKLPRPSGKGRGKKGEDSEVRAAVAVKKMARKRVARKAAVKRSKARTRG